eukprot:CAMPEP_0184688462 /NCGR_PEP_ID=MMETSP0312-20130426/29977_1 /TAXON_ID=31354 /ORGANISM="Compsopogon coeruleus, Strain SAG 36.94" /LENGTH=81 /DNA_ID=CAMNT_0027145665 /DNA_START=65 /DNA_END=306 /DNA_ORIENTATION=+
MDEENYFSVDDDERSERLSILLRRSPPLPIGGLYLVENFLPGDIQSETLRRIDDNERQWKLLRNRRVQNHGGLPHEKGMVS